MQRVWNVLFYIAQVFIPFDGQSNVVDVAQQVNRGSLDCVERSHVAMRVRKANGRRGVIGSQVGHLPRTLQAHVRRRHEEARLALDHDRAGGDEHHSVGEHRVRGEVVLGDFFLPICLLLLPRPTRAEAPAACEGRSLNYASHA